MGKQGSCIKRLTDIIISLFTFLIFSPIIFLAVIAIKLETPGPAFFLHERTGYRGRKFKLYKLRGMVSNALEIGPELTQKNDHRITKVGKILRRTSIDEIPNLINVLKGEMSIVGPRPEIISVTEKYIDEQKEVYNFKPGITGISQVNGRQTLTPGERVKMEIAYYKNETFWSDLVIVVKTFFVVLNNKGNL
ncbi:MAG: sugar transferase [Ignavibacteria bacterium GWA2_35_9]|nr:MAG: sugar transferase [Ignavibacteria bacterium GWA2_35_9]OGU48535.1 MAG: sugar transferase [Ignavibacteria bacterium GWC2_36_12]